MFTALRSPYFVRCLVVANKHGSSAKPPLLVDNAAALSELASRLSARSRIAIDTEAASFHRYVDRVYLIQLASDHEVALVDPLALEDLSPIGALLANPDIEVVFHDSDYDLRILDRDYGFVARHVFDTRIAAQLTGEESVGLAALLDKHFHVVVNKKFQRADWSQRPLTQQMIAYAADDTRYLIPLRDRMSERLKEMGRLEWAEEEFSQLESRRWTHPVGEEDAFLRIKGARALSRRALAILRELHSWRETMARTLDRAPFRILGNVALINLARAAPGNLKRLAATPGVPSSAVKRHGPQLLQAIAAGLAVPGKDLPMLSRVMRPEADRVYDMRLERLKMLRNQRAADVAMEPGLLCPNGTLQAIARAAPETAQQLDFVGGLRRWQRKALGEEEVLAAVSGPADLHRSN